MTDLCLGKPEDPKATFWGPAIDCLGRVTALEGAGWIKTDAGGSSCNSAKPSLFAVFGILLGKAAQRRRAASLLARGPAVGATAAVSGDWS